MQFTLVDELALPKNADVLRHLINFAKEMAREKHRHAMLRGELSQELSEIPNPFRVKPVGRLIQNEYARLAQAGPR
jgi:hypothetical protein